MRPFSRRLPMTVHSTHSLYSAGQCLFSIMGILGLMLIFAGIPDYVDGGYPLKSWSITAFVAGALMIVTMLAGNFLVAQRYRKAVEQLERQERALSRDTINNNDKPPSYEDLLKTEESPPTYDSLVILKPPRYEPTADINWCPSNSMSTSESKSKNDYYDKRKSSIHQQISEVPLSPTNLIQNSNYVQIDIPEAGFSTENIETLDINESYQTQC